MKKDLIILGTAHLDTTPGKCSPDGKFREAVWSREFVADLKPMLESYGLEVMIDWIDLEFSYYIKFLNTDLFSECPESKVLRRIMCELKELMLD